MWGKFEYNIRSVIFKLLEIFGQIAYNEIVWLPANYSINLKVCNRKHSKYIEIAMAFEVCT